MNIINIIDVKFDVGQRILFFTLSFWSFFAVILLFIISYMIKKFIKKKKKIHNEIVPVILRYSLGGQEIEYQIIRNYQNIEIAHRIYVELVTRKAALPIDEEHDVIVEIYNSWYTLFQTTREELKALSGESLLNNDKSDDLIRLLTDILNVGLRPHLTEYQAKFRKWYNEALDKEENESISPQQIQTQYEMYEDLIASMKDVNQLLIEYAEKLRGIVGGINHRVVA
ncbi:MAG: hypothetical protein LBU83_08800 [Bacteroidales bacterium]|jgi:hypothetical protein|nr:hypothetical protein [Bacteroidales bacterium]